MVVLTRYQDWFFPLHRVGGVADKRNAGGTIAAHITKEQVRVQKRIRIAVQLQPQHADYAQIRDAVRRAEDLGVDVEFNWDRLRSRSTFAACRQVRATRARPPSRGVDDDRAC